MLALKLLLADDIAVDFSGAVHISKQMLTGQVCTRVIRLQLLLIVFFIINTGWHLIVTFAAEIVIMNAVGLHIWCHIYYTCNVVMTESAWFEKHWAILMAVS